jgi:hypothetical protein
MYRIFTVMNLFVTLAFHFGPKVTAKDANQTIRDGKACEAVALEPRMSIPLSTTTDASEGAVGTGALDEDGCADDR